MDRLPALAAIRAFEAAGRHEHFSRAADELGMTQAAVSYQVKELERQLGKPLFLREGGRVRLSETGKRLLPAISQAFGDMREAFASLSEESAAVLSVSAPVSLGVSWLSARVGRFQLAYPDIALRLQSTNDLADFAQGRFDLALRVGRGSWEGMRSDFLLRSHITPMCSPEFLEKNAIRSPEDLLHVERLAPNDPWWAGWMAAAGVKVAPTPRRGIVLDSQSEESAAAQSGFGIALMTPFYWRQELESGRLVRPFETVYQPGTGLYLVHPKGRVGIRKVERFREWIKQELRRDIDLLSEELLTPLP